MAEHIDGTATGNSTFRSYDTLIPSLSDNADIVSALKIYHYGSDVDSAVVSPASIAGYLEKTVDKTIITAKGDILVGTANDTPGVLSFPGGVTNGQYLVTDSTNTVSGLKWELPEARSNEIYLVMGVF